MSLPRRPLDDPRDRRPHNPHETLFSILALALAAQPFIYLIFNSIVRAWDTSGDFYDSVTYKLFNILVFSAFRIIPIVMVLKLRHNSLKMSVIILVSAFWLLDVLSTFGVFNIYDYLSPSTE